MTNPEQLQILNNRISDWSLGSLGRDLTVEVLGSVLFIVLVLFVGLIFYWAFGRRKLARFFGVTKDKSLRIYIGYLPHPDGQQTGAVGFEESAVAHSLGGLFTSLLPSLSEQPGLLKHLQLSDIDVSIAPAREGDKTISLEQSLISIGSRDTNYASRLIEEQLKCPVRFHKEPKSFQVPGLPVFTSESQGVIARTCQDDKCYFYIAGLTEPATAAAAHYLLLNWRGIRKRYPDYTSFFYLTERQAAAPGGVVSIVNGVLKKEEL